MANTCTVVLADRTLVLSHEASEKLRRAVRDSKQFVDVATSCSPNDWFEIDLVAALHIYDHGIVPTESPLEPVPDNVIVLSEWRTQTPRRVRI